jgi:hypothetical protein
MCFCTRWKQTIKNFLDGGHSKHAAMARQTKCCLYFVGMQPPISVATVEHLTAWT